MPIDDFAVPRRLAARFAAVLAGVMLAGAGGVAAAQQSAPTAKPLARIALLKKGSTGPAVKALQRALGITADGAFGPATRRAVKAFQREHGLEVDGIAGPATLSALGVGTKDPSAVLARIAACESGGDPTAVSRDGRYRGKYQFSRATWRRLGGTGDPAAATEAEQDRIAGLLLAREGTTPWPTCG